MTNFKKLQISSNLANKDANRKPNSQKYKQTLQNNSSIRVQRLKSQKVQGVNSNQLNTVKVQYQLKMSIFWSKVSVESQIYVLINQKIQHMKTRSCSKKN